MDAAEVDASLVVVTCPNTFSSPSRTTTPSRPRNARESQVDRSRSLGFLAWSRSRPLGASVEPSAIPSSSPDDQKVLFPASVDARAVSPCSGRESHMMRLAGLVKAGERRGKHRVAVEVDGRELVLSNLDKVMYPAD